MLVYVLCKTGETDGLVLLGTDVILAVIDITLAFIAIEINFNHSVKDLRIEELKN